MPSSHSSVIKVEQLSKTYGKGENAVKAIKACSFEIFRGETVALLGPSGSGKTTLITMIGCITEPTQGKLYLDGELIFDQQWCINDTRKLRRQKIGFIFQSHNLIPFLNVEENITLVPLMNKTNPKEATLKAQELLEYLGVGNKLTAMPSQLSGGQSQRVAIARSLANNPKIILADEPTAALDGERALSVMQLLKKLAIEQDVAILVVTHDERMIPLFDRIIRVNDGFVIEETQ
ncbi:ABC transporter ATP-binding protein [Sulfurospirillum diekertiae]|uniref:ABC transporter ATP-binding protein n=1 Tax=Sulfurospirillum diekertiae TaxID=1854492 RepID=A0A290HHE6_9BACT|nr:ABC transporter ATP-binding protein [Sulfurospirillum diekertiae]ATB70825.1 Macrolide export ATP-binding/permease protein MacB [Sulfurospirillum diekertiae]QIR75894.1 ABC transporter ATP-binding protein [Sulfurospirillum diekertiae]QIR78534.1 ABC transporter ATP-binding protein [Sulfurospirillum diekertiae]